MALFAVIPTIGIASPYLALPALTQAFGADGWASVAVGQSIGLAVSVPVELGWGLVGPQRIAQAHTVRRRRRLVVWAIVSKSAVAVPLVLIAAVLGAISVVPYPMVTSLTAVATSSMGLTMTWYFIGADRPAMILLTDALPKLGGIIVAAWLLNSGAALWVYPLLGLMLPALMGPLLTACHLRLGWSDLTGLTPRRVATVVYAQRAAVLGRTASALYISLPAAILSFVAPAAVPMFSAADRLMRMGLAVLQAVPNAMQSWVGSRSVVTRRARAHKAVWLNAVMGAVAGLICAAVLPYASRLVFSGVATVSGDLAALAGGIAAVVCTSRATGGLALVAHQRVGAVALSASAGALVGVPTVAILGSLFGAFGGLLGVLAAELTVLGVQLLALVRVSRAASGGAAA